jgi:hypothetical protein
VVKSPVTPPQATVATGHESFIKYATVPQRTSVSWSVQEDCRSRLVMHLSQSEHHKKAGRDAAFWLTLATSTDVESWDEPAQYQPQPRSPKLVAPRSPKLPPPEKRRRPVQAAYQPRTQRVPQRKPLC